MFCAAARAADLGFCSRAGLCAGTMFGALLAAFCTFFAAIGRISSAA